MALAALLAVSGAGLLAWARFGGDDTAVVTPGAALAGFREAQREHGGGDRAAPDLPRFGVYVYATRGSERLDLLIARTHTYGPLSTIAVEPTGCGLRERWQALGARWSAVEVCPAGDGWAVVARSEHHEFFGSESTDAFRCAGDRQPRPIEYRVGLSWSSDCRGPSGTVSVASQVVGLTSVRVGSSRTRAARIRTTTRFEGENTGGSGQIDLRRLSDGLLLRRTVTTSADIHILGGGAYEESYSLRLRSPRPRR